MVWFRIKETDYKQWFYTRAPRYHQHYTLIGQFENAKAEKGFKLYACRENNNTSGCEKWVTYANILVHWACELSRLLDWNQALLIRRILEEHCVYEATAVRSPAAHGEKREKCGALLRIGGNSVTNTSCTGLSLSFARLFSLSAHNERGYFIVKLSKREQETMWWWQPTFLTHLALARY